MNEMPSQLSQASADDTALICSSTSIGEVHRWLKKFTISLYGLLRV